jgi:hypothetical protein
VIAGLILLALLGAGWAPPASDAPARALISRVSPAELSARLERDPAGTAEDLKALGRALTSADSDLGAASERYLLAAARERGRALARRGAWSRTDVLGLVTLQLVDPERFASDAAFRGRVLSFLPRTLDPDVPAVLRGELLAELNQVRGIDFAASEQIESAWGAARRRSADRRAAGAAELVFDADVEGRLIASVYSLPSLFFDAATAEAFLRSVRAVDPDRTLLVLTDQPLLGALAPRAGALGVRLLDTYGRPYSPWPRDPFSLVHTPDGAVRVLVRPNLQPGREEDAHLGPELVQNLPDEVDRAWGGTQGTTWAEAPVPFHNGQVLLTGAAAWVTVHTLEPRILALLRVDRVPVESFATAAGVERYAAAARQAAAELGKLYGRPVRFVHPMPAASSAASSAASAAASAAADSAALLRRLGGGAGYDLDSLVTFLPREGGKLAALVADFSAGRDLLARLAPEDLESLRSGYGLEPAGAALAAALAAAQKAPQAEGLDAFLDLTAEHLAAEGLEVGRLPILSMPVALLRERAGLTHEEFLLTWNNVVVEIRNGVRAEGFASLLPRGDREAVQSFAALGARLDLLQPLPRSVILNGGYRCASNHVRRGG